MRLPNEIKKLAKQHSKHFKYITVVSVAFVLIYIIVAQYITPFQNNFSRSTTVFYQTETVKADATRATVIEANGQNIKVKFEDGKLRGQIVELEPGNISPAPGQTVLVSIQPDGTTGKYPSSYWRVPGLVAVFLIFILIVFLVIGKRGAASLAGLLISISIIAVGLIPAVLQGVNAFFACIVAAFIIAGLSVVIAHGWKWRSFVSLISIYVVLLMTVALALIGGALGHLTGVYDETSAILQVNNAAIDMRGILLGGIVIATLGVLDDIVTAQTAVIDELHRAQPKLSIIKMIQHGYSVGSEHVVALVNTLALVYVGASLPTILLISSHIDSYVSPLILFNTEFIAQEIVRTVVSSIALVMAVPISTIVAALLVKNKRKFKLKPNS